MCLCLCLLEKIKSIHKEVEMDERIGRSKRKNDWGGRSLFCQPKQVMPTVHHQRAKRRSIAATTHIPLPQADHTPHVMLPLV